MPLKTSTSWERVAARLFLIVGVVVLTIGAFILEDFGNQIHKIEKTQNVIIANQTKSIRSRQGYQADHMFIICSRSGITDPSKQPNIDKICSGYDTPKESLATEKTR